jgi:hypothetical protein
VLCGVCGVAELPWTYAGAVVVPEATRKTVAVFETLFKVAVTTAL